MAEPSIEMRNTPSSSSSIQKTNNRVLSFIIKALVMTLVTSVFFIFVGFAAIVLIHLCIAEGTLHRRRQRESMLQSFDLDKPYSLEDIHKLPKFRSLSSNSIGSPKECVICISMLHDGELCTVLPGCGHAFHLNCIDKWLIKMPLCPICRSHVLLSGDEHGSGSGLKP